MHNATVPFARHCRLPEPPALASPTPRQSGSLHLAPDQHLIAVADYDNDTVTLRSLYGVRRRSSRDPLTHRTIEGNAAQTVTRLRGIGLNPRHRSTRSASSHTVNDLPCPIHSVHRTDCGTFLVRSLPCPSMHRSTRTLSLILATSTLLAAGLASAQSAIDRVGDAFRTAALGVRARSERSSVQPSSLLNDIDDTQQLSDSIDGPPREAQSVHPTIATLRGALWYWLDETERQRLHTVDATQTSGGDTTTLQLFLADRALRRFAPMALAVRSRRHEAIALRRAAPLRTIDDAVAVARNPTVLRILRRREYVETSTAATFARRLQRLGAAIVSTTPSEEDREFAADRAVIAAAEAARTRDPTEVAMAIAETNIAYGGRAARSIIVDEAIHLLEELVAIARGNPAVERPLPPLPIRIDPDANDLPIGTSVATIAPHSPTRGRHSRTQRTHTPSVVRRAGPAARCYDDFRCFDNE